MSISRKEDGSLVRKAGLGIVDNILNRFSNNAVSNKAVTEAITEINNDLTELKRRGFMPTLNYSTPLHDFNSVLTYTAVKDCYLVGSFGTTVSSGDRTISINNTTIATSISSLSGFIMLKLKAGDVVTTNGPQGGLKVFEETTV